MNTDMWRDEFHWSRSARLFASSESCIAANGMELKQWRIDAHFYFFTCPHLHIHLHIPCAIQGKFIEFSWSLSLCDLYLFVWPHRLAHIYVHQWVWAKQSKAKHGICNEEWSMQQCFSQQFLVNVRCGCKSLKYSMCVYLFGLIYAYDFTAISIAIIIITIIMHLSVIVNKFSNIIIHNRNQIFQDSIGWLNIEKPQLYATVKILTR